MPRDIFNPDYWADRLRRAADVNRPHFAVFVCSQDRWDRINTKHREILARHVGPRTSILDVGCGYGRLLDLVPSEWDGWYMGVDVSPDMIETARKLRTETAKITFEVCDARDAIPAGADSPELKYDLAVLVSVRGMVRREAGDAEWAKMETNVRAAADKVLYLEYDEADEGSLE